MNLSNLETKVFNAMGWSDGTLIKDYMRQEVRDAINEAYEDIISHLEPYAWFLVRESSFVPVDGTTIYTMDDRARKVLAFFTRDERARSIPYLDPFEIDYWGLRNTSASTAYTSQLTWYQDTITASSSGAAGVSEGASITSGSTALTKAGGAAFSTSDVGKLIRLNGEVDLEIAALVGDDAVTLSVPYIGKLTGETVANTPGSLTEVSWEVSPPGRKRIEVLPSPTASETLYYYYEHQPTPLLSPTDVPLVPLRYHKLIYLRALSRMFLLTEAEGRALSYSRMFGTGMGELIDENRNAVAKKGRTMYLANSQMQAAHRPYKRDQDVNRYF